MIKKIWHHYLKWEDYLNGMYKTVTGHEREVILKSAIEFTGDHEIYGLYMLDVISKWPITCEQNLSGYTGNKQAWIGHAACCLAIGIPEDITREAWSYLTIEQQDKANHQADEAIRLWELKHVS